MESLYTKYRPQTFDDVVGQAHVVKTLEHAVIEGRTSHAYLFCGPRGTGKTTMARLLAKALMCEQGEGHLPDGTCEQCRLIAAGEHPDVYELDAASRTGVDNVREEIISRVSFAPVRAPYKMYIIDEVHMLTVAAFNALLKTLEEPPGHVVFVLCTTDPQKIPETILSRVQRFDFHPIGNADIQKRLAYICEREGFGYDPEALELVVRHARGGMRDAISELEQLSVSGGGNITVDVARDVLGEVASSTLERVSMAMADRDVPTLFAQVESLVEVGRDLLQFTRALAGRLRDVYVVAAIGATSGTLQAPDEEMPAISREAKAFGSVDRVGRALQILSDASTEMRVAPNQRLVLEVALTKIARPQTELTLEALADRVATLERQVAALSVPAARREREAAPSAGNTDTASSKSASRAASGPKSASNAQLAPGAQPTPGPKSTLGPQPTSSRRSASGPKSASPLRGSDSQSISSSQLTSGTQPTSPLWGSDSQSTSSPQPTSNTQPASSAQSTVPPWEPEPQVASAAQPAKDVQQETSLPAGTGSQSATSSWGAVGAQYAESSQAASRQEASSSLEASARATSPSGEWSAQATSPSGETVAQSSTSSWASSPQSSSAREEYAQSSAASQGVSAQSARPSQSNSRPASSPAMNSVLPAAAVQQAETSQAEASQAQGGSGGINDPGELQRRWKKVVDDLLAVHPQHGSLLMSSVVVSDDGSQLTVSLPKRSSFARKMLERADVRSNVDPVIGQVFGARKTIFVEGATGAQPPRARQSTRQDATTPQPAPASQPAHELQATSTSRPVLSTYSTQQSAHEQQATSMSQPTLASHHTHQPAPAPQSQPAPLSQSEPVERSAPAPAAPSTYATYSSPAAEPYGDDWVPYDDFDASPYEEDYAFGVPEYAEVPAYAPVPQQSSSVTRSASSSTWANASHSQGAGLNYGMVAPKVTPWPLPDPSAERRSAEPAPTAQVGQGFGKSVFSMPEPDNGSMTAGVQASLQTFETAASANMSTPDLATRTFASAVTNSTLAATSSPGAATAAASADASAAGASAGAPTAPETASTSAPTAEAFTSDPAATPAVTATDSAAPAAAIAGAPAAFAAAATSDSAATVTAATGVPAAPAGVSDATAAASTGTPAAPASASVGSSAAPDAAPASVPAPAPRKRTSRRTTGIPADIVAMMAEIFGEGVTYTAEPAKDENEDVDEVSQTSAAQDFEDGYDAEGVYVDEPVDDADYEED